MMLSLLLAVALFVVLVAVLLPLLRAVVMAPEDSEFDQAVYRDQLQELERDIARGRLVEAEATGARLEIQRRLLSAADRHEIGHPRLGRSPVLATVLALVIAGGSIGLYVTLGAPAVPDMPIASRKNDTTVPGPGGDHPGMAEAAKRLEERLKADPSSGEGWLLYARTTALLDRWDTAGEAYKRAIDLGQKGADVFASYGEMLVLQARGVVTPAAKAAMTAALAADPKSDIARYYLGLAAGQSGEAAQAIGLLQSLLADMPEDSSMRGAIGKRIIEAAQAAGLPVPSLAKGVPAARPSGTADGLDAAQLAAAATMPDNERKDMIRGMVGRLAAKLETTPNDLDGWMRLGRAYAVIGEADKAAVAIERAVALKPGEVNVMLQGAQALLAALQPNDPLPPRAVAWLRQVEIVTPEEPEVLWYLGVVAARDGKTDVARGYWERLMAKLPNGSEEAKMVKAAMDAVKGR